MKKLKDWRLWASVIVTVLGMLAANGDLGSGTGIELAGWVGTIGSLLGVHAMKAPADPAPPSAPATPAS